MKYLLTAVLLYTMLGASTLSQSLLNKLQATDDKLYIVTLFASWCGACKKELPYLKKLAKQIDQHKATLIGVDIDRKLNDALAFQKKMQLNFKVINDTKADILKALRVSAVPAIVYIKKGKILKLIIGGKPDINRYILEDIKNLRE